MLYGLCISVKKALTWTLNRMWYNLLWEFKNSWKRYWEVVCNTWLRACKMWKIYAVLLSKYVTLNLWLKNCFLQTGHSCHTVPVWRNCWSSQYRRESAVKLVLISILHTILEAMIYGTFSIGQWCSLLCVQDSVPYMNTVNF